MTVDTQREVDRVGDRIEALTGEQQLRILWRLVYRDSGLVDAVVDEFEATGWRWGE